MTKAILCNKYELPLNFDLKAEDDVSTYKQSYAHFVAEKPGLVAAKAAATDWLLDILNPDLEYTSREYFAGVGIVTCILNNKFKITSQVLSDSHDGCVAQLNSVDWNTPTLVRKEDARKTMGEANSSDLKFYDFPASSILHLNKKWSGLKSGFSSQPKLLVWTDTSCAYPYTIHGKRYAAELGLEKVENREEYISGVSSWLYSNFGYSIARAAIRGTNAMYFAALPGQNNCAVKAFTIKENEDSFKIV